MSWDTQQITGSLDARSGRVLGGVDDATTPSEGYLPCTVHLASLAGHADRDHSGVGTFWASGHAWALQFIVVSKVGQLLDLLPAKESSTLDCCTLLV